MNASEVYSKFREILVEHPVGPAPLQIGMTELVRRLGLEGGDPVAGIHEAAGKAVEEGLVSRHILRAGSGENACMLFYRTEPQPVLELDPAKFEENFKRGMEAAKREREEWEVRFAAAKAELAGKGKPAEAAKATKAPAKAPVREKAEEGLLVINRASSEIHLLSCTHAAAIAKANRELVEGTEKQREALAKKGTLPTRTIQALMKKGLNGCRACLPAFNQD